MDNRRGDKRAPIRDGKLKIKQETLSPDRPQRSRRSSSGSSRSSASPPPRRRAHSSPVRERDRSPGRRDGLLDRHGDRPAADWRSRSPHHRADHRIKREKEEHNERGNEIDERHVKREEQRHHRRDRERGQERHRDGSRGRDAHLYQQQQAEREQQNERRQENRHRQEENETLSFGDGENVEEAPAAEKEKPSFELSGALVEDTNTYKGVVIKYNEPPEARIPKRRWRLYPFKNDEPLPVMYIHRQSAYLLGRQRRIADIPIDHPSCSKQHAVFQYRLVEFTRVDGTTGRRVKPYIIDLGSGNGTYLNNQRIEPQRYYELKEKDVLKFGFSSREYVLLHEFSDTTEVDAKKEEDEEDEEDEGLDE